MIQLKAALGDFKIANLVKMFTNSLSKPIIAKPVSVSNASPELLKEIINGGRK